jgi:hypothetical protein
LAGALPAETYQLVETLLRTLQWVTGALAAKQTTLGRLRRLLFGTQTEKSGSLLTPNGAAPAAAHPPAAKAKAKGHGRQAAQDYPGAQRQAVAHPKLHLGDLCPQCLQGKLYLLKTPARIVRIAAQPIFSATVFELERLRCALCGTLFTAPAPPQAGPGKYDPSCGVMLNLQRFGAGQPMYRTDKWQHYFGVPLPASTQWQLMAAAAQTPDVVYEALIQVAAQAELLHNDDTPMRVQSLRREKAASQDPDARTGIFTTGIIAQVGPVSVALFFTGQNHAGENLNTLLQRRAADRRSFRRRFAGRKWRELDGSPLRQRGGESQAGSGRCDFEMRWQTNGHRGGFGASLAGGRRGHGAAGSLARSTIHAGRRQVSVRAGAVWAGAGDVLERFHESCSETLIDSGFAEFDFDAGAATCFMETL